MGYAGGTSGNPTYRNLGGHSEAIQIDYDPEVVSYEELLNIFWDSHDPSSQSWSRQYRHILFYHSEQQRRTAEESRDKLAASTEGAIVTDIAPYRGFYLAEDYHQKHALRNYPGLVMELKRIYPETRDLVSSTAVSRINGYLGSYGTCDQLRSEIMTFGLSDSGINTLLEVVCGGGIKEFCSRNTCS